MTLEAGLRQASGRPGTDSKQGFRADFVVMRVPLLAIDTLASWAQGARAGAAVSGPDAELAVA
ncbi:MAG: hypothetical protein JO132_13310, partial [Streptosporangiaceae bacterium]|nr:hypothetical protein [Streptosporangiaceae bacterium]